MKPFELVVGSSWMDKGYVIYDGRAEDIRAACAACFLACGDKLVYDPHFGWRNQMGHGVFIRFDNRASGLIKF